MANLSNAQTFCLTKLQSLCYITHLMRHMILHLGAAPGHSYRNPSERERVNCILNLGLYGMGVMRQKLHAEPDFEHKLSQFSNLSYARKLIAENEEKNAELVKQSCAETISLMSSIFKCLSLKGNKIEVC